MSTARIPPTDVTGLYGRVVKIASRRMLGEVPESLPVMWNHPTLFKDLMGLGRKAEKWNELDPVLASLATMASAALVGCSNCLDLHYFLSRNKGLDQAKAQNVPRWRESNQYSPLERQVMEYAEAMCQTPPAVTDEMSARLLGQLGPAALMELSARVGLMNATARINISLGIGSQGLADSCGLPPLAARPTTDVV